MGYNHKTISKTRQFRSGRFIVWFNFRGEKERPITPTPVLPENEVEESELNKLEGQFTSTDQGSASVNLEDMEPRKVVKGEDDTFVKEEPGGAQARATVDKIPEASPMPVFKRRKAKAS